MDKPFRRIDVADVVRNVVGSEFFVVFASDVPTLNPIESRFLTLLFGAVATFTNTAVAYSIFSFAFFSIKFAKICSRERQDWSDCPIMRFYPRLIEVFLVRIEICSNLST